jgi:hypothetical protein
MSADASAQNNATLLGSELTSHPEYETSALQLAGAPATTPVRRPLENQNPRLHTL